MTELEKWNVEKSRELYGFSNWGQGYFGINDKGHVVVRPDGAEGPEVDLYELVQSVGERDISLPVLFRFNGILRHRVQTIYNAFTDAIAEYEYNGAYTPAYPIKVNQQRHIVGVLQDAGREFSMGLEVGSKPELIAVLGIQDQANSLLLCNGYKDSDYVELALLAKKVGRRPVIVIEKLSELPLVLEMAQQLNVQPEIGFRLRLSGKGAGRWERSGGDRAKFGLTIGEILAGVQMLKEHNMLECLSVLHFHLGSQLTSIDSLKVGIKEACQVYVQLRKDCPNLTICDVGGGLAVDYDGSKTAFESSMNYTLEEYARDVVWIIKEICDAASVPHPEIVTESGRATAAYHSVLVCSVLGTAQTFSNSIAPDQVLSTSKQLTVRNMAMLLQELGPKNCQETLNDALELRRDMLHEFNLGLMSIEDRALGDRCYWTLLDAISRSTSELNYVPEDLERLPSLLTDTYFCNFSVFQSLPDSWAIQQIFPITPVHRLAEQPTARAVVADITCDSDGKIDRFADLRDVKRYLPAHRVKNGEPYYFACYLAGAYQEILGDLHNLFGDTNAVHVDLLENGQVEFSNVVLGDSVKEVLRYVQYDKEDLCERWRNSLERAVSEGRISASESASVLKRYVNAFNGYTYLGS